MSKDLQIQSIFRLTPMQQGILFHSLLDQTSYAYFEQVSLTLNGLLEVELLDRSLSVLFERHEILRSNVFHVNIEEPKLIVFRQKHPAIHFEDISSLTQSDQVAYIEQFVQRDKANGFDITRDELFRVSILQCASDVYKLIVSFHHIIMDGWCLEIVLKEWFQIYTSLQKNEPVQLGEAPSYEKYLKWLDKQDTDIALTFWERYLDGFEQQSILPASGKGSHVDYDPQQQIFSFDSQLTGQLESLAKELKVTLSTLFHSIWGLLLMKYNNTRDVVFGSVVSGRPSDIPGAENMVGLFINTIPVRISSEEDHLVFSDFVQHVQHSVMEAGQHHYVPLADIQAGSLLKSNLIHHILAFENFPGMEEASDHENENSLAVSEMAGFEQTNYSFNLNVVPGEKLRMKFSYNGLLYEPEYIDRLGRHVEEIARTVVSSADIVLHEIDIILPEEKEVILKKFNGTAAPYPREKTIHQLFEEQVERTPEHPAALYQNRQLTYRELNAQANRVAHVLRKKGIGPDQMVGIAVHRSLEMIVGLLGILKAGGAYLPLHPEDPEERLGFMLEDSGASILLTQRDQLDRLRPHGADRELIAIEDLLMEGMELTGEECGKNPEPVNRSSDLVYVIYTSGSTGKPKGVMIEHASLINRLYWMEQRIPFGAEDVILQKTPYTFDVSLWELFSWAIQGATVCFLEPGGEKDPATIVETVEANGVTAIHFVPSMLGAFLEYIEHSGAAGKMRSVRRVFASGEALMTEHVRRFNRLLGTEGATLHNLYGPTEATVEVAYYDCPAEQEPESIPIGKPIDNVKLYILDHKDRLQPIGVPGELHIGGDCVARGYVNRKELTEEKFVEDPYTSEGRMYRTGDLARWLPDGNIEYMGRIDHQVKIRGYRIELGEIEAALLAYEGIKAATVLALDDRDGGKYLCAYVESGEGLNTSILRAHLKALIPDYMVPSHFVRLDVMPHLSSGKVNRKALPEPEHRMRATSYVAPRNETERKLAEIWEKLLDISSIGIHDNFFELGGHSLTATRLMSRINKLLQVEIPLRDIFAHPTIEEMSVLICGPEVAAGTMMDIAPAELRDSYPVTSVQKRQMILHQFEGAETAYNMPFALLVEGELDIQRLEQVFRDLIDRHEALRTSFEWGTEEPVQKIHSEVPFQLSFQQADDIGIEAQDKQIQAIFKTFVRPFDLGQAPLLRAKLVRISNNRHILMVDMHHIVADGVSMSVLANDFTTLYHGNSLPPLRIQYKDYAVWNSEWIKEGHLIKQEQYWLDLFSDELPVLNLPTDFTRPQVQSFEGDRYSFQADKTLREGLQQFVTENRTTLFMVLLSAYNVLLHKYSSQEDIVVGSPIAGRNHTDLENIMGMFVNTLVLRNRPAADKTLKQFLLEVQRSSLEAFEHQDYPIEDLVDKLELHRDLSRNPLFDTMFSLENTDSVSLQADGISISPYSVEAGIAKVDLTLTAEADQEGLSFRIDYCNKLFHKESIERMSKHYLQILQTIVDSANARIGDVNMVTASEEEILLTKFNTVPASNEKENRKLLHQLFEEQVAKTPERVAVSFEEQQWTYSELNDKANQLARVLREKGVQANTLVGMMVERSFEMIVGILGILKAGGAYVPLAPDYPAERISLMLYDCKITLLLASHHVLTESTFIKEAGADGFAGEILDLDQLDTIVKDLDSSNLPYVNEPDDLAYVLYTSGSTGKPKGNLTMHYNVERLIKNSNYIDLTEQDILLQLSNYAFDGSVFDIFGALVNGSKLVLLRKENMLNPEKLSSLIRNENVSVFFITTALFNTLIETNIECFTTIRKVLFGGERVSLPHVSKLFEHIGPHKMLHMYGPTESTVFATCYGVDQIHERKGTIPIGAPITGTTVYILDKNLKLQPIGIPGELCIAGDALSQGYLNLPDFTNEKFIDNPFNPGEKMYKTGDIAKWLPDGNIEFVGRQDHLVKIRGFRIELGEIENQLLSHERIKEAIVVAKSDPSGQNRISAYMVTDGELNTSAIRHYLAKYLPDYMLPSSLILLDSLPLNANGKVDQKKLPEPHINLDLSTLYEPPTSPTEEKLVKIWEGVLGQEGIGISHSFFDLGGDSIKAIQVIARLSQEGLKLDMKDIFQHPTVQQVAPYVQRRSRIIDQKAVTGEVQLTPIQRWFFENVQDDRNHFNQAVMLFTSGVFDEEVLKTALENIIIHHDALRMAYEIGQSSVCQYHTETQLRPFHLNIYNLQGNNDAESKIEEEASRLQATMDLRAGEMIRVGLFQTDQGQHLLIAIHHLVIDGVSWRILLEDLESAYTQALQGKAIALPDKTDSFQYWSDRLAEYSNSRTLLKEKAYWQQIEGVQCESPFPQKSTVTDEGGVKKERTSIAVRLDKQNTQLLLGTAHQAYNTEINDLLLSALGLAIKQWAGSKIFAINLEGHGREEIMEEIDVTRTIGWFTSMFPIVLDMRDSEDISSVIRRTKEMIRHIPNRGIGYGVLKYLTDVEHTQELDFNIQPQISFNYLGQFMDGTQEGSFESSPLSPGRSVGEGAESHFTLDINSIVSQDQLLLEFGYIRGEHADHAIEQLSLMYIEHLKMLINHCTSISQKVLTPSDYQDHTLSIPELDQILKQFGGTEQVEHIYPLTPMQQGMLFHYMMEPETTAYVEQVAIEMEGELQQELLEQSFQELLAKYEVLRTNFVFTSIREPRQVVRKHQHAEFQFYDLTGMDEQEITAYLEDHKKQDLLRGFDLSNEALIRINVLKTTPDKFLMMWTFHHMIMDGWCVGIVYHDFMSMYLDLKNGRPLKSETAPAYSTYIRWLEKQDKEESMQYWKQALDGYTQCAVIPKTFKLQDKEGGYRTSQLEFSLDQTMTRRLTEIASHNRITVNTLFQSIWGALLQRYNNTNDVVFGAVVSGRPPVIPDIESMVGIFINTIPVRIYGEENESFIEMAKRAQQSSIESVKYEYTSLADIQSITTLKQSLLDHIIVFENYPEYGEEEALQKHNLKIHVRDMAFYEQTNYDFNLIVSLKDELNIKFLYNADTLSREFVECIKNHLNGVVRQIVDNPEISISSIEVTSLPEKEVILNEFNNTTAIYPRAKTIHQLFEEQVERTPEHPAALYKGRQLTYRELNAQANRLAHVLREKGVGPDRVVGIAVHRSLEMIIGLLGILKAGGAYLPLNPEDPEERLAFMLEDSGASILLTQQELVEQLRCHGTTRELIAIEDLLVQEKEQTEREKNPESINRSTDLVYVIYTSGSTGKPKGVMIEHASLINRLHWMQKRIPFGAEDVILQKTPYTFDVSLWELFSWAIQGATVCFLEPGGEKDPATIAETVESNRVTALHFVPSMLGAFLEYMEHSGAAGKMRSVRRVFASGEALMTEHVRRFNRLIGGGGATLHNLYGPTEATVEVAYYDCPVEHEPESIPIGKPIDNVKLYILDKKDRLQPIGIPGELHIGGDCVARGYVNREELTEEKFVEDPYEPGGRMYRTGDLARWLPDGNIEYMGRIDHQVKIRGYRIELGEIEAALLAHDGVRAAAVLARADDRTGMPSLGAYVVAEPHVTTAMLRQNLSVSVPEYMIPAYFVFLDQMPLTSSGKINRRMLLEIELEFGTGTEYVEPSSELEKELVEIWMSVLGIEHVGIDDNFFELGGHSLTAIQLASRLQGIWSSELRLSSIYQYPTVRELALHVEGMEENHSALAQQFDQIIALLHQKLNVKGWLQQEQFNGKSYIVLHLEDGAISFEKEIMELLDMKCDESIQPHYITWHGEETLRLEKANLEDIKSIWTERIDNDLDVFSKAILSLGVIERLPVSPTQRYHLQHSDISGTIIPLEKHMNMEYVEESIRQIIREQDLMRSTLCEENGELQWQVREAPDHLPVPLVDISMYDEDTQQVILNNIVWPYFYRQHELSNSLLYRILIVKKNLKDYMLILPFSHSIFDFMSSEIIKHQFNTYYECVRAGKETPKGSRNRYSDFTTHIMEGPQGVDDLELATTYNLDKFDRAIGRITDFVSQKAVLEGHTTVIWDLKSSERAVHLDNTSHWEIAFFTFTAFCKMYFGLSQVPIWVTQYGRSFGEKRYYDVIGEFVDHIPILTNLDKNLVSLEQQVRQSVQWAAEHNISFANLMYNPDVQNDYPLSGGYLQQALDRMPIVFNFLGELRSEHQLLQTVDLGNVNVEGRTRILCEVWHDSESNLFVALTLPFSEDESIVRNHLQSALEQLERRWATVL